MHCLRVAVHTELCLPIYEPLALFFCRRFEKSAYRGKRFDFDNNYIYKTNTLIVPSAHRKAVDKAKLDERTNR